MKNISKYWILLESLKLKDLRAEEPKFSQNPPAQNAAEITECEQRFLHNKELLQKFMKLNQPEILIETLKALKLSDCQSPTESTVDTTKFYMLSLQYVLLEILQAAHFDSEATEDLISLKHINLFIAAVHEWNIYALKKNLHATFYKHHVYASELNGKQNVATDYVQLEISIEVFAKIVQIKTLQVAKWLKVVLRDYMAGIFSLFIADALKEWPLSVEKQKQLQLKLNNIWIFNSKDEYFFNILLFKSMNQLPNALKMRLHQELMEKLTTNDGFATLVITLADARQIQRKDQASAQQLNETIANIVAFKGHPKRFHQNVIQQIFAFLKLCLVNKQMSEYISAGLLPLKKLYELNEDNQRIINELIYVKFQKLSQPVDIITGLILMENSDFHLLINLIYNLFCVSYVECLPTKILKRYLPMLFQIYHGIPANFQNKKLLSALLIRCLNNQTTDELAQILDKLYKLNTSDNFDDNWQQLHRRIVIFPNATQTELNLKIASADYKPEPNFSLSLTELLINEEFHLLTYQIFTLLLRALSKFLHEVETETPNIDLIQTEDELLSLFNKKYAMGVEVIYTLQTLISHQPLRAQIRENVTELLKFVREFIEQHTCTMQGNTKQQCTDNQLSEQTLLLLLTLAHEMLENTGIPENFQDFMPVLKKLEQQKHNQLIQQRIQSLIVLLRGDFKANAAQNSTAYNTARALIETKESHLQVLGIQMLLEMIKRKDASVLANVHLIVALALTTLKDKESYTFLNCVRLFAALVHVVEAESDIFELLIAEYLNEAAQLDYRLVVGECIVKVSKELGPLCYKYKNQLLNCFLHGARSTLNEFRASAYSNLAQLCRTLAYQVNKFFHELINLITNELTTGTCLPARRAAVYVLSELFEGIDNIKEFESILLPIYRILKFIESSEKEDPKMRLHAANGLKALNEKCIKFLFPAEKLEKDIKIFGVKDPKPNNDGGRKKHILELN